MWRRRPLRWSPQTKRHYDQALARHHTDAEEDQLQGEHADRVQNKLLYRKALEVLRFLRKFRGSPSSSCSRWPKTPGGLTKSSRNKWGDQPPGRWRVRGLFGGDCRAFYTRMAQHRRGGKVTLYTPEADIPREVASNLLDHSALEGERTPLTPPSPTSAPRGTTDASEGEQRLGEQIPVTPEWPWEDEREPLPRRRARQETPTAQGEALSSHPRVYGGRVKEAWEIQSKLAYREQRRLRRRQGTWGKDNGTASSSGKR